MAIHWKHDGGNSIELQSNYNIPYGEVQYQRISKGISDI